MGCQSTESVDKFVLLQFPQLIAPLMITNIPNGDIINVTSIAVAVSQEWKVELLHTDGTKLVNKIINQSPLSSFDVQLFERQ